MALKPVIAGMFYRSDSGALKPLIAGMAVQNGSLRPLIAGFLYQSGGGDIPVSGSGTIQGYSVNGATEVTEFDFTGLTGSHFSTEGEGRHLSIFTGSSDTEYIVWFNTGTETPPAGGDIEVVIDGGTGDAGIAEAFAAALDAFSGGSLWNGVTDAAVAIITNIYLGSVTSAEDGDSEVPITVTIEGVDASGEITDAEVIPASVGSFISLETAVITTNALGFESEWELYWDPDDVVLFTSTPPTDPNLSASDIFGELAETVSPLSNSLRARITGAIPDAPQQIVTIAASGILAPPGTFAEIQFPSGDEFSQSGSSDFVRLYLGSSVGSASHVFWGQAGTSVEPTGLTGTITFHEISVDGLEADEVRDLFCQSIVNTGLWTIPGFTQQTAPVNTVPPTIDNESPYAGQTITCSPGTWTMTPTSYTYQWKANAVNIGGATNNTYDVIETVGVELTCAVTAHNAIGSSSPVLTSNEATVIEEPIEPTWTENYAQAESTADETVYFDFTVGSKITLPSGTVEKLSLYVAALNTINPTLKLALLDSTEALIASGSVVVTGGVGAYDAYVDIVGFSEVITGGDYYVVGVCSGGNGYVVSRKKTVTGEQVFDFDVGYTAFPTGISGLGTGNSPYPVRVALTA